MSRVVAFASAKGGSGKSVTCLAFAQVLAGLGLRVVVADLDIETAGMTLLNLDAVLDAKRNFGDADLVGMFEPFPGDLLVVPLPTGVNLAPAQVELRGGYGADSLELIRVRLVELTKRFDYVLLDLQAGADLVSVEAARLADDVVLVAEFDPVSVQGVRRLERLHPDAFAPQGSWIIYNKVLPEIASRMSDILRIERKLPPIPWLADVVRAYADGHVPTDMVNPTTYTLAIIEGVESLFGSDVSEAVMAWRLEAENQRREPVLSRLAEVEAEMDAIERQRIEIARERGGMMRRTSAQLSLSFLILIPLTAITLFAIIVQIMNVFNYNVVDETVNSWISAGVIFVAVVVNILLKSTRSVILRPFSVIARRLGADSLGEQLENWGEGSVKRDREAEIQSRRLERVLAALEQERLELAIAARRSLKESLDPAPRSGPSREP